MDSKRLPLQPLSLKGDLKDFIYISPLIPANSSFFLSFGISLLETLIRLKCCSNLQVETWSCIIDLFPSMQEISKKFQLEQVYDAFIHFFSAVQSSPRKDSMELLETLESSNKLFTLDLGMRMLAASVTNNYLLLRATVKNHEVILNQMVKRLKISVFLIINSKYKVFKLTEGVPVVCLYCNNSHFAVLYHRATKYVDEKPDPVHFDPNKFPFANSSLSVAEVDLASSPVLDLINFLASQVSSLAASEKQQLEEKLQSLGEEFKSASLLPSIRNLLESSSCSHNSGSIVGKCGKLHCSECLKTSTRCPCGTSSVSPTSFSNKIRIRSVSNNRGARESEKVMCSECRKPFEVHAFSLIQCKSHYICNKCRSKKLAKGRAGCPTCNRDYTAEEKQFLAAVSNILNN